MGGRRSGRRVWLGAAGLVGGLLCSVSMVAATVGQVAAAGLSAGSVEGMPGMVESAPPGTSSGPLDVAVQLLIAWGPVILIGSAIAMAAVLWKRRMAVVVGAVIPAALLYWGMYGQRSVPIMYAAIAVGLAAWLGAYLWAFGRRLGVGVRA